MGCDDAPAPRPGCAFTNSTGAASANSLPNSPLLVRDTTMVDPPRWYASLSAERLKAVTMRTAVIAAAFAAVLASATISTASIANAVPRTCPQYSYLGPDGFNCLPTIPGSIGGAPAQEQAPASGDNAGGRCDWAQAVGWSQFSQCYIHVGPQSQQEYDQQRATELCHQQHGPDPDHYFCTAG